MVHAQVLPDAEAPARRRVTALLGADALQHRLGGTLRLESSEVRSPLERSMCPMLTAMKKVNVPVAGAAFEWPSPGAGRL